jgi:hypothetical protein
MKRVQEEANRNACEWIVLFETKEDLENSKARRDFSLKCVLKVFGEKYRHLSRALCSLPSLHILHR